MWDSVVSSTAQGGPVRVGLRYWMAIVARWPVCTGARLRRFPRPAMLTG